MKKPILFFLLFSVLSFSSKGSTINIDSILNLNYTQMTRDLQHSKNVFEGAAKSAEKKGNENQLAILFVRLGVICHLLNNNELSVKYFNKSILLFEKNNDEIGAGNAYAELGNSMRSRDINKSKKYFVKGITLLEKNNSERVEAAYDNYGVLLHKQGKVDSALFYFQKTLSSRIERKDSLGIPFSLQKIAMVNVDKGAIIEALENLNDALLISERIQDTLLICETHTYFGDVYMNIDRLSEAVTSFEKALTLSRLHQFDYLVKYIYSVLPDLYFKLGNREKAYQMLKAYSAMKDSILNEERVRSIAALELSFETTQKEQKIELLEKDVKIKELGLKQSRRIGFATALVLLLLAALLALFANSQKLKHKTALLLQREDLQKERIKSVIVAEETERERVARELHDGLGQLLSAAKMHVSSLEEDVEEELKPFLQNSIKLVDQACVEVREISHALLPKRLTEGALEVVLQELKESVAVEGKLGFDLKLAADITEIKGQRAVAVYRIIQELVNNSIKHAQADLISLSFLEGKDKTVIKYSDNGKRFSVNMIQNSNGIGWKNIYSRVEFINGEIEIESVNGAFNATIVL